MFIEFKSIEFKNYKAIKSGKIVLSDRGVVLVQGINNDKGGSNGAGKSTVYNGLLWCLFDRTLVGKETENEILPKFIKKSEFDGCSVSVIFSRDNVLYNIVRHRKHPTYKNSVVALKYDYNKFEDISLCTDKDTNELITSIVGADFDSFVHSNIFSFNNTEPFLMKSDKDKKELVLPSHFIETFKKALGNCKDKLKKIEEGLLTCHQDIIKSTLLINEKRISLESIKKDIELRDAQKEQYKQELTIKKQELEKLRQALKEAEAEFGRDTHCLTELRNKQFDLEEELTTQRNMKDKIRRIEFVILSYEKEIAKYKLELEKNKNTDIISLLNNLETNNKLLESRLEEYENNQKRLGLFRDAYKEEEVILVDILTTKEDIERSIHNETESLIVMEQQVLLASENIKSLESQTKEVYSKYYNEACKSCSNNKMEDWFRETSSKIKKLEEGIKEWEPVIRKTNTELERLKNNLATIIELERRSQDNLKDIESSSLNEAESKSLMLEALIDQSRKDIKTIEDKLEEDEHLIADSKKLEDKIKELEQSIEELKIKEKDLMNESTGIDEKIENNKELLDALRVDIKYLIERSNVDGETLSSITLDINTLENQIKHLNSCIEMKDDYNIRKENLEKEINRIVEEEQSNLTKQKRLGEKLELLQFWKVGFSPSGIEGFMMDSIINTMNQLIDRYLGYLSNNTISLTLIPESTLKTGDTRNKISDKVTNESGGLTYRTNSEGEKRIMDIAVLFSLKYIYEHITGTKYNLLFCDEAFDTLDASTCSLVVNLINNLDGIDSIFVVSHIENLALEFDNFIKMVKTRGITEVVE